MSDSKIQELVDGQAQFFAHGGKLAPIHHYPSEKDLEYETLWFPALDGVWLEAWFMPCKGSKQLIICNHPMTFNKGGFPGTLPGFDLFDPIDVNFIPDYKYLHDAGYNVLAYDQRNHGRSNNSWGKGVVTTGHMESRDMAGCLKFVREWSKTKDQEIALYPRCMGANATINAFNYFPEYFKDIKCMVALQPVSANAFVEQAAKNQQLDVDATMKAFDKAVWNEIGLHAKDLGPQQSCHAVKVPTLVAQVRDDVFIDAPKDTQEIYDLLGTKEKKLYWITGTTRRFDGYNYFGEHPEEMLEWFKKYFPVKK